MSMTYDEAKRTLIATWGAMSSSWGINKSMAQIHALLLASRKPMNTDDMMEELGISRGNVSMSVNSLQEWGLIYKTYLKGSRKDFYVAEKDMWLVGTRILEERRRKELETMLRAIKPLRNIEDTDAPPKDIRDFNHMINELHDMTKVCNRFLAGVGTSKKLKVLKVLNKISK